MSSVLTADMIVFVNPIYYYSMSAQIKAVIDRFYANNAKLAQNKKAILIAAAHGSDDETFEGTKKTYEAIIHFLNWKDAGILFARGCPAREIIEATEYPKKAYLMGKAINPYNV